MTLEGRRVLVTGATGDLGREVALRLSRDGCHVLASGRNQERLLELEAAESSITSLAVDLLDPEARDGLPERAHELLGGLDAIVHSAGVVRYGDLASLDEAELRLQTEVNWLVPLLLTRAALPFLHRTRERPASVTMIASTLGLRSAPKTVAYSATKAALLSSVRSLAQELAPTIRVNAVVPGVIDSEMIRNPIGREVDLAALEALHPMARLGQPSDVADAVRYLMSASWVTGTELVVDGGLLAAP